MLLFKEKKKENTDSLHKEYGVISNIGFLLRAFAKYRKSNIPLIIVGGIAAGAISYVWSFLTKLVIDMVQELSGSEGAPDLAPLVILTSVSAGIVLVLNIVSAISNQRLTLGFDIIVRRMGMNRIAKIMSMEYQQIEHPDMLDRSVKAARSVWGGISALQWDLYNLIIKIAAVIAAVSIISTLNFVLVIAIFVLSFIQFEYFDYIRIKDKEIMWDAMAPRWRKMEYMTNTSSNFSYAKDIRIYGMKKWLNQKHKEVNLVELKAWVESRKYWGYNSLFGAGVALVRNVIIYGYLIFEMLCGDLSIGDFTLYTASAVTLSTSIYGFLESVGGIREHSAKVDDYRSFIDIKTEDDDAERKYTPVPKADEYTFVFENVSFKYMGQEKYALKNLNLTLKPGQRLAVVGLNGAGKSTLVKLLMRLYDVTDGRILCNGIDVREFNRSEYYKLFSPAFQDSEMFAMKLCENVSMQLSEDTDAAKAEEYLRYAGFGEKLDKLPQGMDTEILKVLYDDGVDLSGGERQKLALARALYKNAPIIILDEPTAALDALAEYELYQKFDGMASGKTAVYISHRLSSTRFCDKVAMFKGGEMVEYGTHDELLAKEGAYAEMFRVQAQYYVSC